MIKPIADPFHFDENRKTGQDLDRWLHRAAEQDPQELWHYDTFSQQSLPMMGEVREYLEFYARIGNAD